MLWLLCHFLLSTTLMLLKSLLKLKYILLSTNFHAILSKMLYMQLVTRMGLFGLGIPEVAVIAGVAVLIFGELQDSLLT